MPLAAERRQLILEALSARRYETVKNLSFEFGVSVNTIRRDIDYIQLYAPVITRRGNGGGVYVMDGWYVSRVFLRYHQEVVLRRLLPTLSDDDQKTIREILENFSFPR